jgi:two-component system, oxyanion-binding sensor
MLEAAKRVFRSDLYDEVVGSSAASGREPADGIGAFTGPPFNPADVEAYLAVWKIRRPA